MDLSEEIDDRDHYRVALQPSRIGPEPIQLALSLLIEPRNDDAAVREHLRARRILQHQTLLTADGGDAEDAARHAVHASVVDPGSIGRPAQRTHDATSAI